MRGKYARNNFSRNTGIVQAKNIGKKSSENVRKNRILYIHEYRTLKTGEKDARNNFSRNTRIERENMLGKNHWEKVRKKVFYIHTYIELKKGRKKAQNNFSRNTPIVRAKNFAKKLSKISPKKRFLYSHEYRVQNVEKNA